MIVLALLARPAGAQSSRILDHMEIGVSASRAAHAVQLTRASVVRESVPLGTLIVPISGVRILPGGVLRARLATAGIEPNGSSSIQSIQVTLATIPRDYGKRQSYQIRVDGLEVYRAVEADPGGGPTRSLFIDLPAPPAATMIEIAADPSTAAPITVTSLRVHAFQSKIQYPKSKMGLALVSPLGGGYGLDETAIRDTFHKLPHNPCLEGQLAVLYNFSKRTARENAAEIDRLVALAEKTGIPLRIAFQVHWGGIPRGVSDGAGGTFTDLPYQQITFDPADKLEDTGLEALMGDRYDVRFGLSIPNRWADTPWLTFNHPRLNQLRRIRLTQALFAWREAREHLLAVGKGRLLPPELSTGDETVYWAKGADDRKYTDANSGVPRTELMADFNPFVVADALKDGVNLDPRDGLNMQEREWLHRNMASQQQRLIDWMFAALPAEPIRLAGSTSSFAPDLPRRNLYTEPYAMPLFPMKGVSPYRPGLEVGLVRNGRSGGEYWSGATMLPWLLKERERGRIALPNLECSGADPSQVQAGLQAAYACGARFATIYNWQARAGAPKMLRAFADSIDKPAGSEFPSVAIGRGAKWEREYVAPPDAWGINRIELYPQDRAAGPIRVSLRDMERGEEATVNTTPAMEPNAKVAVVLLPTLFHQEPGRRYLLSVEALDTTNRDPVFGVASDIKIAARLVADIRMERTRSQSIAAWQDARDLLDSLKETHDKGGQSLFAREALERAETLFTAGRAEDAYNAGIRAEQLTLPASFALPAPGGRLAPYWITILCPNGPVRATITTYSPLAATVILKSPIAQRVTMRWGSLDTTAALTANVPAEITLVQPAAPAAARRRPRIRRRRPAHPPAPFRNGRGSKGTDSRLRR